MATMIDQYAGDPSTVFIADRGYESYNVFAHAQEKGGFYLVRERVFGNSSIIGGLRQQLPHNDEYDSLIPLKLTRKQTKEIKEHPETYKFFPKNSTMDYIDLHENKYYDITLRIVRFKLADETYECLITNFPPEDYPKETLKELYAKRWGIETSFRELKYAIGVTAFHTKK